LLKPAPYLVQLAMSDAAVPPARCVLVGDSLADLQAAHAVAVPVIVYANKVGKRAWAEEHGAEAVIDSMAELVRAPSSKRAR
jgi:phosphoglycolate phosphatase-like HAD superfamily hydrolase